MQTIEMTQNLHFFLNKLKAYLNHIGCSEQALMVIEFVEDTFTDDQFQDLEKMTEQQLSKHAMVHALGIDEAFNE